MFFTEINSIELLGQRLFSLFASPLFDEFIRFQLLADALRYLRIKVAEVVTRRFTHIY